MSKNKEVKVVWKDPEADNRGRKNKPTKINALIEVLKSEPNRWALITETAKPATLNPKFRTTEFERAYRIVRVGGKTRYRNYVRFVGGGK